MSSDELQDLDGDSLLHSLLLVSKHFGVNTNAESLGEPSCRTLLMLNALTLVMTTWKIWRSSCNL